MKVDTVRRIDRYIGIPLCLLLSALHNISSVIRFRKREPRPVRKVLFIKLSELGSIILSYPLLKSVKERYPSAELFFVTFHQNQGVFEILSQPIPDKNILTIRDDSFVSFGMDTLRAVKRLRREKIDIIFDLEFFSRYSAIFAYLVRAAKIVGFYHYDFEGLYRGTFLTHRVQYNPLNHITKTFLALSQVVGEVEKNTPEMKEGVKESTIVFPRCKPNNGAKERVLQKLKNLHIDTDGANKLFLINPGEGTLPLREWPIDNFIALSRLILAKENNHIIMIGTDGANDKTALILKTINSPRCVSLVGQTELDELLELFNISDALLSNDCGLAHLAMLTSIRKFILFGPESPCVFGPLGDRTWIIYSNWPCSPCLSVLNHRKSSCADNVCLKVIKPQDVYESILKAA